MVSTKPPVPFAFEGIIVYDAPAAVVADDALLSGVKLTSEIASAPAKLVVLKLVVVVLFDNAVPYDLVIAPAVIVKDFFVTVPVNGT